MKRLAMYLALAPAACGCAEPRHPERDSCYLAADEEAAREYALECAAYEDTRTCPEGDAIEARHQKAQEACK